MINRLLGFVVIILYAIPSIFYFFIAVIIWLFTFPFDKRLVLLHQFTSFWAAYFLWVVPAWSVKTEGRKKIDKNKAYIVVSNHQSQLDILVAFKLFFHFKWVSKAEVYKIPIVGWVMMLNRYIKLKRGDKASIKKMYQHCQESIEQGSSIFIFPEGTRSKTGILRPFKNGAFNLAQKLKVPILPVVINGTKKALPKHSIKFHGSHKITIKVLDEIPYEDYKDLPTADFAEQVRSLIGNEVEEHVKS